MVKMGDVWDRTTDFLGDKLSSIMPIAILAFLVPTSISTSLSEVQANAEPAVQAGLGLLNIAFTILQIWGQLVILAWAVDSAIGDRATRLATARLLPTLGVYLIVLLAFLVLMLPFVAIVVSAGVGFDQMRAGGAAALTPGTASLLGVYGLVFVVAVLFIAARLAVLLPVIAFERRGAGAISRSFALTRGSTWRLVGVLLLYVIVVGVSALAVQLVFGAILGVLTDGEGPVTVAGVITAVAGAAVMTVFTVLATAFIGKLYVALAGQHAAAATDPFDVPPEPA